MDSIESFRKSIDRRALQALGQPTDTPRGTIHQAISAMSRVEDILNLPETVIPADEDTDPASPSFKKKVFVLGASALGGDDPIGGF